MRGGAGRGVRRQCRARESSFPGSSEMTRPRIGIKQRSRFCLHEGRLSSPQEKGSQRQSKARDHRGRQVDPES